MSLYDAPCHPVGALKTTSMSQEQGLPAGGMAESLHPLDARVALLQFNMPVTGSDEKLSPLAHGCTGGAPLAAGYLGKVMAPSFIELALEFQIRSRIMLGTVFTPVDPGKLGPNIALGLTYAALIPRSGRSTGIGTVAPQL